MSAELRRHVRKTLGFPKKRVQRIAAARAEVRKGLRALTPEDEPVRLPRSAKDRARLVFDTLKVPVPGERPKGLTVEDLEPYREQHPLVPVLLRLGRMERGIFQYNARSVYEKHKAGVVHHAWLTSFTLLGED